MIVSWALLLGLAVVSLAVEDTRDPITKSSLTTAVETKAISMPLFATLERLSRIVDIAYCVGTSGVSKPFECVSRCKEFPTLSLVTTWNTGALMSDSCGYIAVDHGRHGEGEDMASFESGDPAIVVAFRGTYSITNTIVDLSTVPQAYVPYPPPDDDEGAPERPGHECTNCTVHMGFLESWKQARELVIPQLRVLRARYPAYPIQLVGHSLGGAVACLAALELKITLGYKGVVVTTFGEPKGGNYQFARFVDKVFNLDVRERLEERPYRRVTHKNDPVPLLPLSEWGYKPHSGEIYISKQDLSPSEEDLHNCVGDEDPQCSAGADDNLWERMQRYLRFAHETVAPQGGELSADGLFTRFKLWQLFFAHRDYFWRLGLCVPGGDPADWGRDKYGRPGTDEL